MADHHKSRPSPRGISFKGIGLAEVEVGELKHAIEDDGPPSEPRQVGPKVTSFLGKLGARAIGSAASGTVSAMVVQALSEYFGWMGS